MPVHSPRPASDLSSLLAALEGKLGELEDTLGRV